MKWGVEEFIFAISSDSEFYRLMQWLICMITHSPVYSWKCRNVFKIPKEFVLYGAWMLTLKWLATVGGPLLALSPFVAELSWAAIFFLDSCGNDCMQKDAMIENRRSTSSKPLQCLRQHTHIFAHAELSGGFLVEEGKGRYGLSWHLLPYTGGHRASPGHLGSKYLSDHEVATGCECLFHV